MLKGRTDLSLNKKICLATYWLNSELRTENAIEIWYELSYCFSVPHSVNSSIFFFSDYLTQRDTHEWRNGTHFMTLASLKQVICTWNIQLIRNEKTEYPVLSKKKKIELHFSVWIAVWIFLCRRKVYDWFLIQTYVYLQSYTCRKNCSG